MENLQQPHPNSTGQVLKSVGYGEGLQNSPKRVLESEGFRQALRELGLTEELITTSLVQDIQTKEGNRLGELRLGAEILQMKRDEPEEKPKGNTYNFFFNDSMREKAQSFEEEMKKLIIEGDVKNK